MTLTGQPSAFVVFGNPVFGTRIRSRTWKRILPLRRIITPIFDDPGNRFLSLRALSSGLAPDGLRHHEFVAFAHDDVSLATVFSQVNQSLSPYRFYTPLGVILIRRLHLGKGGVSKSMARLCDFDSERREVVFKGAQNILPTSFVNGPLSR